MMENTTDYKNLLLQLIASLTLCENEGDISEDCYYTLEKMGIEIKEAEESYNSMSDISYTLSKMNITTLHGSSLSDEDDKSDKD
jgi:hypothetical protein